MGKRAPIVILNDFSTREGGAGYLANALADNLAQKQYPVTFICGDHGHDNWSDGVTPAPLNQTALLDGSKAAQATRGLYNRTVLKSVRNWRWPPWRIVVSYMPMTFFWPAPMAHS